MLSDCRDEGPWAHLLGIRAKTSILASASALFMAAVTTVAAFAAVTVAAAVTLAMVCAARRDLLYLDI